MKKQRGIILLNTLLMASLLALLVLSQMQLIVLHSKAMNELIARQRILQGLEAHAVHSLLSLKEGCVIEAGNPDKAIEYIKTHQNCLMNIKGRHSQFVTEDLGIFPCLQIMQHQKNYASHQWRLTLQSDQSAILQLRIANPEEGQVCKDSIVPITSGIISWRYVTQN